MIAKQFSVRSFRGAVRYLEHGHKNVDASERVAWSAGRNLPGEDPVGAGEVMRLTASGNPRVQDPGYHFSISFPPEDRPSRSQMEQVADRVLQDLGLSEHEALIVAHKDTEHPHFHVLANRVHPETLRAWDRWQDRPRMQKSLRHLEQRLELRMTPGNLYRMDGLTPPNPEQVRTSAEIQRQRRTGQRPFPDVLRDARIGAKMRDASSWSDLEARLGSHGLWLKKAGRGLQVTDGRETAKASSLDRKSSLKYLEDRFGQSYGDYRGEHPQELPTVDVAAVTPERLEGLEEALSKLERWDALKASAQEITQSRSRLPNNGSLPDLESRLVRKIGPNSRALDAVYQDPESARRSLDLVRAEVGAVETCRRLQEHPESFGRLHGRGLGSLRTAERTRALSAVGWLGDDLLVQHDHREELKSALESAEGYRQDQLRIRGALDELVPGRWAGEDGREQLLAVVGRESQGLRIQELAPHLSRTQVATVQSLRRSEIAYLAPLQQTAEKLLSVGDVGQLRVSDSGKRLARRAQSLVRRAPGHVLKQLAPPQLRVAMAAVSVARELAEALTRSRGLSI